MSKFLHTMLRISSIDETLHFFSLLGFKEVSRYDNEESRYTLVFIAAEKDLPQAIESRAPMIELTYNWDETTYDFGRNFGHIAVSVENIYVICKTLLDNNILINRPPRDGRMAFVRTPDNISIELLQFGKPLQIMEPWASMPNIGTW
ncbi:MAG: VOC family protein [Gammaproteobacteria bacterium]